MRIGIIDLGTNSVRFDIQELSIRAKPKQLYREKMMIRLGEDVFKKRRLSNEAILRALTAFRHFKEIATSLRVERIVAFGTSALRDASNSAAFVKRVERQTGISVRVISGEEEAKLIALGVLANEKKQQGAFALIDIGGGSTEVSIGKKGVIQNAASFPLGTARIQQLFLPTSPPTAAQLVALRNYVRDEIAQRSVPGDWGKVRRAIGSSGTIRALSRISKKETGSVVIDLKYLTKLVSRMSQMKGRDLRGLPGIEEKRVDMILSGTVVLHEAMITLGIKKCEVTEFSLRDGILQEEIRLLKQHQESHLGLHIHDIELAALRFGVSKQAIERKKKLVETVFHRFSNSHKLESRWKLYLTAAVILKEVGKLVNSSNYERHSSYIIRNIDLPGAEAWEREFIASLSRSDHSGPVKKSEMFSQLMPSQRKPYLKLLALLSLAKVFESKTESKIIRVSRRADHLHVKVMKRKPHGLEGIMIIDSQQLYKAAFGKFIELELNS